MKQNIKCKIGARSCHPGMEANYEFTIANNKKDKNKNTSKVGSATDKPRTMSNT